MKKRQYTTILRVMSMADIGIEPIFSESESDVLPLHQSAIQMDSRGHSWIRTNGDSFADCRLNHLTI